MYILYVLAATKRWETPCFKEDTVGQAIWEQELSMCSNYKKKIKK